MLGAGAALYCALGAGGRLLIASLARLSESRFTGLAAGCRGAYMLFSPARPVVSFCFAAGGVFGVITRALSVSERVVVMRALAFRLSRPVVMFIAAFGCGLAFS